jgi:hypothetical protein
VHYGVEVHRFVLTDVFPISIIDVVSSAQAERRWNVLEHSSVPDYFQEETGEALRSQVDWLKREIGLDTPFLVELLATDEQTLTNWRLFKADLPPGREDTLRDFWHTTLHILSFLNFDLDRVRELFQYSVAARSKEENSPLAPPWSGMTLKEYFERVGRPAVENVDCWVTGLRFSDPYPS